MAKKEDTSIPESKHTRRFLSPRIKRKEVMAPAVDPGVPRITNETVTQHREEVLSGARKYIYPLRHSRHKIVITTVVILVAVIIGFMSFTLLSLYKFQSTSSFMYQVTKFLPLPVGRIGGTYVSYESYLFELRHYIHYYENQSEVDFNGKDKAQLDYQRKKSLDSVINYAYVQKIAKEKNITVSEQEVTDRVVMLQSLSRLGSDQKVTEDVLKDYFGMSVSEFRRSLKQQIITSKVLETLDMGAKDRANAALGELKAGANFADVAKKYSEDLSTKDRGGEFLSLVSKTDKSIAPQELEAINKLQPGEVSGIVGIDYGIVILKNLGVQDGKTKTAGIFIYYQDINNFLNDYKDKQKAHVFIRVQQP